MIAATTLSSLWSNTEPSTSTVSGKEILLPTNTPGNSWAGKGRARFASLLGSGQRRTQLGAAGQG